MHDFDPTSAMREARQLTLPAQNVSPHESWRRSRQAVEMTVYGKMRKTIMLFSALPTDLGNR
jgi:hypothetical protein